MNTNEKEGISLLRGNPKTAVLKLSIPLMLSMMVISLYNIIDSFWIAGLGADELAAVGFVIPLEFLIISIGSSLGAGITSVVSKYIGAQDDKSANNAAAHGVVLSLVVSVIVTAIFTVFAGQLLAAVGARGVSMDYALQYGHVYFLSGIIVIMPNALYGLLRSEGDTKRTMYAMVMCAVLNMILDPVFIYWLDLKMFGAALSTVISLSAVLVIIIYWIYIKKDTYLKPFRKNFSCDFLIVRDILKVAVPSVLEMILITFITAVLHFIILAVSTTDSVAVFENGWRMITLAAEPLMAVSTALVSVVAANYGGGNSEGIRTAYNYSLKLATFIGIAAMVIFLVFAPQIAYVFSYASTSVRLLEPTAEFFRIFSWFFIVFPAGIVSTYVFQGLGKGTYSLVFSLIREAVCAVVFSFVFGIVLGWGIDGVWFGIMFGYSVGGVIAALYARYYLGSI